MTYQPGRTLSRELYGSSKRPDKKRRVQSPRPVSRARGLSPAAAKKLPTISEKADRFFKSSMRLEDDDREPTQDVHESIQTTIAEFKRLARELHLEEMREKGVSDVDETNDEWA